MSAVGSAASHGTTTALEARNVKIGMRLFIVSEVMLFAAFFAAYFYLRREAVAWPPSRTLVRPELGLVSFNTLVLLSSSVTLQLAHAGRRSWKRWLGATIALGTAFLAVQAFEFSRNTFSIADGVFGSTFYTLTGFHGMHVAVGLLLLGSMALRARRGLVGPSSASFAAVSYYWHFVDAVWLFLFTSVYVV